LYCKSFVRNLVPLGLFSDCFCVTEVAGYAVRWELASTIIAENRDAILGIQAVRPVETDSQDTA